jgi:arginine deiminase
MEVSLYNVNSEVGRLKKILLHKPGLGLGRLTPDNCKQFLFDSVLDIQKAKEEHDVFQKALEAKGVEVFLLTDLLLETLRIPEAKKWLIERRVQTGGYTDLLAIFLKEYLYEMSPEILITCLLEGLTKKEIKKACHSLVFEIFPNHHFIFPPLPNHLFMRDSSCWIGNGVSIHYMAKWNRRAEALHLQSIYQFHPMFKEENIPIWYGGNDKEAEYTAAIEGGDILVIGNGAVLIGMGERTTPQAVEKLSQALFKSGKFKEAIVVTLPKKHEFMHLDTVMTMLDYDAFIVYDDILKSRMIWRIRPDDQQGLVVERQSDLFKTLAVALDLDELRIFTTGGDVDQSALERKNHSNNTLVISPGVLMGYEQNILTNTKLRQAGFDVIDIPGAELSKGRGGVRCMSCPLLREA